MRSVLYHSKSEPDKLSPKKWKSKDKEGQSHCRCWTVARTGTYAQTDFCVIVELITLLRSTNTFGPTKYTTRYHGHPRGLRIFQLRLFNIPKCSSSFIFLVIAKTIFLTVGLYLKLRNSKYCITKLKEQLRAFKMAILNFNKKILPNPKQTPNVLRFDF